LIDNNDNVINDGISLITVNSPSQGGSDIESTASVKKYATQLYASQYRAVTASDYEAIVPTLYPETESVSAFGGEVLTPPEYGKVFISIKPLNGVYISEDIKENLVIQLKSYSVVGIVPVIIDLKYLYLELNVNAYYNSDLATSASAVKTLITNNIETYSKSKSLNMFGARFKYSQLQTVVDNSSPAMVSNITLVNMRRDMEPVLNSFTEYEICFGNRFHIGSELGYNIKSSGFKVSGISETVYLGDKPSTDMKSGTIFLFKLNSPTQPVIVRETVGTIDYIKGEIKLNPLNVISTSVVRSVPLIEISVTPYSNDVLGYQDLYLQLDPSSVVVNMVPDNISSGNDISGTNYIVSSSYTNGSLIRS